MIELRHITRRGRSPGRPLTPHRFRNGKLAVSPTRRRADYIYVDSVEQAMPYLLAGHGLRMSAPGHGPSFIKPAFGQFQRRSRSTPFTVGIGY